MHCIETGGGGGGLPTWKNFWLLQPVSNHPPKRQPDTFNCWILFSWCGNLFRSPPYFHDPCIWQFVQFAGLTFASLDVPGNFLAGAGEGHCHKTPIVVIIIRNYPLSFYGASAVNVYPLQNDPPLPISGVHWCVPLLR